MSWVTRYRVMQYLRTALWIYPTLAMLSALVLVRVLHHIEQTRGWVTQHDADTMRTVLSTLAGAMFTFIVFVCSSLLLVVQLASSQLTPRIIGILFGDPIAKLTLSMFVFTFAFCTSALLRIDSTVPALTAQFAAYSAAVCLGLFLYLIDRVGRMLRPTGAIRSVAVQAHDIIDNVYPQRLKEHAEQPVKASLVAGQPLAATVANPNNGVVVAFDVRGLVKLGSRHGCVIELIPQVGNFVAQGNPLFRVYGASAIPPASLLRHIVLGNERTMDQDPAFAFRVLVDIASKGLSPAINDPTTAVLAIDQIHHLLRHVGNRCLDNEEVRDATGQVRLIYRTPDWEDYVILAVTEIRHFGGSSIQVARRLRAMLEDLIQSLPEPRVGLLRRELNLLQRTAERFFTEPEDRALADVSDLQGVGGNTDPSTPDPVGQEGPSP